MNRQVVKLTETTWKVLSEHSAVLFHILLTIHNLYLIITSHQGNDDEDNNDVESNERDANPIESGINGKSDRNSTAAATTKIMGTEEEEEGSSGCHEVASLYISISSYSSSSSSGYSSAASPTTISYLNGSLSDSSLSLSAAAAAAEATKGYHNYYCGNETIPCNYTRRPRRWTSRRRRQRRVPLKLQHFRHSFCSSSTTSFHKDFR